MIQPRLCNSFQELSSIYHIMNKRVRLRWRPRLISVQKWFDFLMSLSHTFQAANSFSSFRLFPSLLSDWTDVTYTHIYILIFSAVNYLLQFLCLSAVSRYCGPTEVCLILDAGAQRCPSLAVRITSHIAGASCVSFNNLRRCC